MGKYKLLFAISIIAIGLMTALLASINEKKRKKNNFKKFLKLKDGKLKMKSLENFIQESMTHGNKQKSLML